MKTRIFTPAFALLVTMFVTPTALSQDCTLDVDVGDNLTFAPTEMSISKSECSEVTVNLTHGGNLPKMGMGHNWVLTLSADADATAQDGWQATLDNQYIMPGDARVLATTDIIGGGESTSVTFSTEGLEVGGDYTYFCSFVGHYAAMKGPFIVTE